MHSHLTIAAFCLFLTCKSLARDVQTTKIGVESFSPKGDKQNGDELHTDLRTILPLPAPFFSGLLSLDLDLHQEQRSAQSRSVSGLGVRYFQHVAEGVPAFRLRLMRLGAVSHERVVPYVQSQIAVDLSDADYRWLPTFGNFRSDLSIGVKDIRQGAQSKRWEPEVSFHLTRHSRWVISLQTPWALRTSYTGGDQRQWSVFAEGSRTHRYLVSDDDPIDTEDSPWKSRIEKRATLGGRYGLAHSWYVGLEGGYLEMEGADPRRGPWAGISLQSWTHLP